MVVGDDDQSIYSWRGADISNILDFEKDFPAAKVVKLEQNYRSTGHILNAANAVVRHNSQRKEKRLFYRGGAMARRSRPTRPRTSATRAAGSPGEIEKLHAGGTSYDDIAVFYRTNAQSRILEDMFLRAGVPYKIVGGTRFFDRAEIRDVMAYLKMVVNPGRRDERQARHQHAAPRHRLHVHRQDRGACAREPLQLLPGVRDAPRPRRVDSRPRCARRSATLWRWCARAGVWTASCRTWSKRLWSARALCRRSVPRGRSSPRDA